MGAQVCGYCQKAFLPSKFQPAQAACGDPACQRRRRNDYHRRKDASDPVYRQVCLDSAQQWRAEHPDYWKQLRADSPARAERNRQRQRQRDQQRRLANNNPAVPQVIDSNTSVPSCQQQPSGQKVAVCSIKGLSAGMCRSANWRRLERLVISELAWAVAPRPRESTTTPTAGQDGSGGVEGGLSQKDWQEKSESRNH
jgi:hypothetical protein